MHHLMRMRTRFPELLRDSGLTPYEVAMRSRKRITLTKVYRLKKGRGKLPTYDAKMLDALCDIFGVEPSELLERERPRKKAAARTPAPPAVP
jgi:DNA-binding Xre family transcriptional regulator